MTHTQDELSTGITRRSWSGIVLVWLAISLPFFFLYLTSRRVVLNEIRNHVKGVAIASAVGLEVGDLEAVHGPEDVGSDAYRRTQVLLDRLISSNPDVRYIYTMRRSSKPFAAPHLMEYIVDQPARDHDGNGRIDSDEVSEPPGKAYNARNLPALLEAWEGASADRDLTPDPPYPDLISGYAPIRDAEGLTVAIVGVDVTAATVRQKLLALRVVILVVWFVICILITMVIHLYYQQRDAFEQNKILNEELAARNEMLRKANEELATFNARARRELEQVHLNADSARPRDAHIIFNTYDLTCAASGPDLYDVFEIDQDHVGFYFAEVGGSGVSAALVSSLLKMAVSSGRDQSAAGSSTIYADLTRPDAVLSTVGELLAKELPAAETVAFLYVVIDLAESDVRMSLAGFPPPLRYVAGSRRVETLAGPSGPPLGSEGVPPATVLQVRVSEGDKLVFCSSRFVRSADAHGRPYEPKYLSRTLLQAGERSAVEIAGALRKDLSNFTGRPPAETSGSLLVAHIR